MEQSPKAKAYKRIINRAMKKLEVDKLEEEMYYDYDVLSEETNELKLGLIQEWSEDELEIVKKRIEEQLYNMESGD